MKRFLLMLPALATGVSVAADDIWDVNAVSSTRMEHYDNTAAAGIYPFEGTHTYTDLQLQFQRAPNPFNRLHGYALGLVNDSEYRGSESGVELENFNLGWERGDLALPFRAEVGDFLGFYSLRSLQRPLKGTQIELQPKTRVHQSLVATAGAAATTYSDFDGNADRYLGLSYSVAPDEAGSLAINVVHNRRDDTAFWLAGNQTVASLGFDRRWRFGVNEVMFEGEAAYLDGDTTTFTGSAENGADAGYFAQLSGRGQRYDYRLRFENYGEHFRPNGAVVVGDRRSSEAYVGWRLASRIALRGRWQSYRDSRHGPFPMRTETAGLQLIAPWLGSTALDVFRTTRESTNDLIDNATTTARLNVGGLVSPNWSLRFGAFSQWTDDDVRRTRDDLHQLDLGADRRYAFRGATGSIGFGLVARTRDAADHDIDEVGPTLRLYGIRAPHDFRLSYSYLTQRAPAMPAGDSNRHTAGLQYSLFDDHRRLTIEIDYQLYRPDTGLRAEGNRIALTYSFSLARPRRPAAPLPAGPAAAARLLPVSLGASIDSLDDTLTAAGASGSFRNQNLQAYQLRVLDEVPQRQHLLVADDGTSVTGLALVVEFDNPDDPQSTRDAYHRTREQLVRQLGPPALLLEQGEFSTDLAAALERRDFVRILEWDSADGRVRFGIVPSGAAGVHMEARVAQSFPPARTSRWGLTGGF